jgi:CubicO group peptidase (beta-lactamase class C family)
VIALMSALMLGCSSPEPAAQDPLPQSVEEFQAIAARILEETGVPGAGIALVRSDGVAWEGGIGFADRIERTPVTADTHFRVGSISKTFIAMALVQLYEDGELDLNDTVEELAPDVVIDNPWHDSDPVRVIHLLQHTAGFDDMHFNEMYVATGQPELSLAEVLALNPASRRVRWRPGTRMAYSNPGYAVAAHVLERVTGEAYEDYIAREIFEPLDMSTSSFRLAGDDESLRAQGYYGPGGPPVEWSPIHLRPAGNLHSSAHELARFVQMLLGWGELGAAFVVDPEYLGNMEQPRTTLASRAGLRTGYGSGIASIGGLPYPVLGHGGGIDGFVSQYAYSPARDVGFVVLLNSGGGRAGEALNRLSSLSLRYLKRDVDPPVTPAVDVDPATLDAYTGYYHDASPRNQLMWPVAWLFAGRQVVRDGDELAMRGLLGEAVRLIPVSTTAFRRERDLDATLIFTEDESGGSVLTGAGVYAERTPRWRVEILRLPVLAAVAVVGSVVVASLIWIVRVRRARPSGFWWLKGVLLLCPVALVTPVAVISGTAPQMWGARNTATIAVFVATVALPVLAIVAGILAMRARSIGARRSLTLYALVVAVATAGVSAYLGAHDLLGLRLWAW